MAKAKGQRVPEVGLHKDEGDQVPVDGASSALGGPEEAQAAPLDQESPDRVPGRTPLKRLDNHLPQVQVGAGRMARYQPDLGLAICEAVAHGQTLKAISKDVGVGRTTINRWIMVYPEFGDAYRRARELSAFALEDEALDLARFIVVTPKDSAGVRAVDVAINQFRWSASRRNPSIFSERAGISVTVPIQINTNLDMGEGKPKPGPGGNADPDAVYTIEAQVIQEPAHDTPSIDRPSPKGIEPGDVARPPIAPERRGRPRKPTGTSSGKPRQRGVYG